jgi:nitrate/nitrite transporter NarK
VTRFSLGALVDKVTFRSIFIVVMLIQLVNALGCFYAVNVPWLFFVCIMLNYMAIGATFTLLPVATTNIYGLKVGP